MSDPKIRALVDRLKRAGLDDEYITQVVRKPGHVDMGSGTCDLHHCDLHLDMPTLRASSSPDDIAPLSMSLELREGINEWIRIMSDRIRELEKRVEELENKN